MLISVWFSGMADSFPGSINIFSIVGTEERFAGSFMAFESVTGSVRSCPSLGGILDIPPFKRALTTIAFIWSLILICLVLANEFKPWMFHTRRRRMSPEMIRTTKTRLTNIALQIIRRHFNRPTID